jgi:hypothetical protein
LHRLVDTPQLQERRRVVIRAQHAPADLTALAIEYQRAMTEARLTALAAKLGVHVESLTAFGVGWAARYGAWSFPMRDPKAGAVIGIRLRKPDGSKFGIKGGKEALFMPDILLDDSMMLIAEGATDAIAVHGIGFPISVGRPSCMGGMQQIVAIVRARKPARVVIVRDNDEPGIRGAEALARVLALQSRNLRVIAPPCDFKDLRAWVAAGANRSDLEKLITAANEWRLNLDISMKGSR